MDVPLWAYTVYALGITPIDEINKVGFARFHHLIHINYILKEIERDPSASSGADILNQYYSRLSRFSTIINSAALGVGGLANFYSQKTHGNSVYALYILAGITKLAAVRQWFKFMNKLIKRYERELKE